MSDELPRPAKVLIIKPSSLGDVVSAVPVLRGLKRTFPEASASWLVTPACAGVLEGQPGLDEIILFDRKHFGRLGRSARATRDFVAFCRGLRRRRFDWVIDLQGLFRSAFLAWAARAPVRAGFAGARELAPMFYTHPVRTDAAHTIDRNLAVARALGIDARPEDLVLEVTEDGHAFVRALCAEHDIAPGGYVVAAPAARWANKVYPVRRWREVLNALAGRWSIVLIGAPGERRVCAELAAAVVGRVIDVCGKTTLPELTAVIASAAAAVCCDSAVNYIAPAVGTPFVTLIGPTRAERTGPYGPLGRSVVADTFCSGCLKRSCPHATCMQTIPPGEVAAAVEEVVGRSRRGLAGINPDDRGADGT